MGAVAALWAWPTIMATKLGFSVFMVPVAVIATWPGHKALRDLRESTGGLANAGPTSLALAPSGSLARALPMQETSNVAGRVPVVRTR